MLVFISWRDSLHVARNELTTCNLQRATLLSWFVDDHTGNAIENTLIFTAGDNLVAVAVGLERTEIRTGNVIPKCLAGIKEAQPIIVDSHAVRAVGRRALNENFLFSSRKLVARSRRCNQQRPRLQRIILRHPGLRFRRTARAGPGAGGNRAFRPLAEVDRHGDGVTSFIAFLDCHGGKDVLPFLQILEGGIGEVAPATVTGPKEL